MDSRRLSKVGRGYSEIRAELETVRGEARDAGDRKTAVMADGIHWGYSAARTSHELEQHLVYGNLEAVVRAATYQWDGQGYLEGAVKAANKMAKSQPYKGG